MRRYIHAFAALTLLAGPAFACKDEEPEPQPEPVKPVCNLLIDPRGDTAFPATSPLDIVSGDVATGTTTLVAVVRVADVDSTDPVAALGQRWDFGFTVGAGNYVLTARRDFSAKVTAEMTRNGVPAATPTVVLDAVRNEVRWQVARSDVPDLPEVLGKRMLLRLVASTYVTPAERPDDTALMGKRAYVDGYPSCVRAE
jgi:hypothetical protein